MKLHEIITNQEKNCNSQINLYTYCMFGLTYHKIWTPPRGHTVLCQKRSDLAEKGPVPQPRSLAMEQGPFCQDPFSFGKEWCAPVEEFKMASNYWCQILLFILEFKN